MAPFSVLLVALRRALSTILRRVAAVAVGLSALQILRRRHRGPLRLLPDKTFAPTTLAGMKTVYVLRHGESQWNVAQKNRDPVGMFGKFDHALTAKGVAQAEALRTRVRFRDVDDESIAHFKAATAIYCSPLTRAIQTALVALAAHPALRKKGLVLVPELRELTYPVGGFDSLKTTTKTALAAKVLRRARKVVGGRSLLPIERGVTRIDVSELFESNEWLGFESRRDASARLRAFVERLRTAPDTTVIVVGHSLFFQALIANFADAEAKRRDSVLAHLSKRKLPNAAIAQLTLNVSKAHHPIIAASLVFQEDGEESEDDDAGATTTTRSEE